MPFSNADWCDRPNVLAYWCAGVLLLGVVLLGWLLASVVSGWLVRVRGFTPQAPWLSP